MQTDAADRIILGGRYRLDSKVGTGGMSLVYRATDLQEAYAAVKKNDPLTVTMYTLLFSFLFLIPFSGLNSLTGLCLTNPMILVVAFLMCLVTAVFAQYFFSVGLGLIESGKAAIYGATEPIVGSLVGIFIFHEESNLMKIIGIIMVIAAILIIGKSDAEKGEEN